jgi:Lar family restriction alleviation protein
MRRKPCPFCGGTELHNAQFGDDGIAVICLSCNARGPTSHDGEYTPTQKAKITRLWNKRDA